MKKYEGISKTNLFVSTSLLLHQLVQPVVEELVLPVLVTPGLPVLGGSVQRGLKGGSPEIKVVSNNLTDCTESYKYSSILASLAFFMTRSVCPESGHWKKYFEKKIFTI